MSYIFLSYLNRSGSTFLVNQLSRLPQICVCPEADLLYELFLTRPNKILNKHQLKKWQNLLSSDRKIKGWKIELKEILDQDQVGMKCYKIFLNFLNCFQKKHFPESTYILFKHNYLFKLNLPDNTNPESKIFWIYIQRALPAIYISQKLTIDPHSGKSMCSNPLLLIYTWNSIHHKLSSESYNDKKSLIIHYESLISDLNGEMDKILAFLKINGSFSHFSRKHSMHSKWIIPFFQSLHPNIDKPPLEKRIDDWENNISKYDHLILQLYAINEQSEDHPILRKNNWFTLTSKLMILFFDMKMKLGIQKIKRLLFQAKYLIF